MLEILGVIALIVFNGFFSLSEMSLMTSRKSRLKQMAATSKHAAKALALAERPEIFLSTVQIGITFVGILTGLFSGDAVGKAIANQLLHTVPLLAAYAPTLGKLIAVALVTCLTLVLGELVPKRLALIRPELIAACIAVPMAFLARVASPGVWLLARTTRLILHALGFGNQQASKVSEEEIRMLVTESHEAGIINAYERDMLNRVMRLSERTADSMMTPRNRIVWLDMTDPLDKQIERMQEGGFSRYPVYRGNDQEIIGVLELKTLIRQLGDPTIDLFAHMREALFVSESTHALKLLEIFREEQQSLALVVDEYGEIQGLVTLRDLMGAVIGRLQIVEDHDDGPLVVMREDGSMLIDGSLPIEELGDLIRVDISIAQEGDFHTLAGLCIHFFGRIPHAGEYFDWSGWRIEVVDLDGARIDKLLLQPLRRRSDTPPDDA